MAIRVTFCGRRSINNSIPVTPVLTFGHRKERGEKIQGYLPQDVHARRRRREGKPLPASNVHGNYHQSIAVSRACERHAHQSPHHTHQSISLTSPACMYAAAHQMYICILTFLHVIVLLLTFDPTRGWDSQAFCTYGPSSGRRSDISSSCSALRCSEQQSQMVLVPALPTCLCPATWTWGLAGCKCFFFSPFKIARS